MRNVLFVVLAAALVGCSSSTEPAPAPELEVVKNGGELTCRSGYAIANRNGELVCVPEEEIR